MTNFSRIISTVIGAGLMFAGPAYARNYDCSKAGNANKAVCKAQAAAPVKPARNYDCSKAGNVNKTVCKANAPALAATPSPAPASVQTHSVTTSNASHNSSSVTATTTNASGPNGATAKCKDGTLSKSAHRAGTCSQHGGVATWY